MFEFVSRSWDLFKVTWNVIKADKELLLFPIVGGFFSALLFLVMILPILLTAFLSTELSGPFAILALFVLFIFYFLLAFVATFFNVCVVFTAKKRFEGGNSTFWEAINFAFSKIHLIAAWSLITATVGIILNSLQNFAKDNKNPVARMILELIVSGIGFGWSVVTIFVIPSMVYKNVGPIQAIKNSAATLKKTWGESIVRFIGLSAVKSAFIFIGVIFFVLLLILSAFVPILFWIVILLGVIYFIIVTIVFSVAEAVFNTALYHYAETGKIPSVYSESQIKSSFEFKQ